MGAYIYYSQTKLVLVGITVLVATFSKLAPPFVLLSITTPAVPATPPAIRYSSPPFSSLPNSIPRTWSNPVYTCATSFSGTLVFVR